MGFYVKESVAYDAQDPTGAWSATFLVEQGGYTLSAVATHPSGYQSEPATRNFSVTSAGTAKASDSFDESGYLKQRSYTDGLVQDFTWDVFGRLVKLSQTGGAQDVTYSYVYDGLGRRLVEKTHDGVSASEVKSVYDPLVEFLEIAVERDGERVWKVYGSDLSGSYGGLQGVGGLEAFIDETSHETVTTISDVQGHILGHIKNGVVSATDTSFAAYGAKTNVHYLGEDVVLLDDLTAAHIWRGYRVDASGFVSMGARYYDGSSGRFISPDPLGHEECPDLYSYAGGDPINFLDPTGRGAKPAVLDANSVGDPTGKSAVYNYFLGDRSITETGEFWDGLTSSGPSKLWNTVKLPFSSEGRSQIKEGAIGLGKGAVTLTNAFQDDFLGTTVSVANAVASGLGEQIETPQTRGETAFGLLSGGAALKALKLFKKASLVTKLDDVAGAARKKADNIPSFTFRGDRRAPSEIFEQGFQPRGTSVDLLDYAANNTPSIYVSTSRSASVAGDFAENIYVVRPRYGVDVNRALGRHSPFPDELEIAIPGGVSPADVRGVTLSNQGISILNPNWAP